MKKTILIIMVLVGLIGFIFGESVTFQGVQYSLDKSGTNIEELIIAFDSEMSGILGIQRDNGKVYSVKFIDGKFILCNYSSVKIRCNFDNGKRNVSLVAPIIVNNDGLPVVYIPPKEILKFLASIIKFNKLDLTVYYPSDVEQTFTFNLYPIKVLFITKMIHRSLSEYGIKEVSIQ